MATIISYTKLSEDFLTPKITQPEESSGTQAVRQSYPIMMSSCHCPLVAHQSQAAGHMEGCLWE